MDGLLQDDLFGIITVGYAELLAEALHRAVLSDDVDALNRLLKEPTADINGLKYGDNLLVTAIKRERQAAAVWLVEHGIDADFETCHVVLHESEKPQQPSPPQDAPSADNAPTAASNRRIARQSSRIALVDAAATTRRGGGGRQQQQQPQQQQQQQQQQQLPPPPPPDLYSITCRQLAYDMQLWKVVSAIDARKGANRKPTRGYPDMRLYRRQRQSSALAAPAASDCGGDAADAHADCQNEADRVPPADSSDDSDKEGGGKDEAAPMVQARNDEVTLYNSPARSCGAPHRSCLLKDEAEEEQRLLTSPTTITWRRSTLTKSAKQRQRLQRKLCAAADAGTGACHCAGGGCATVSARLAPASAADEVHGTTQAQVVGACACQLNRELSRLLTAAASAASAVGAAPPPRPRTVGWQSASKAFSHPSVRRSHSSGRRTTDQPSAA